MTKQKDAVFEAICTVKDASSFSTAVELTKEERQKVLTSLLAGFKKGDIEFNGDHADEPKLTTYTSGLVSNWLRKDKRLNGNVTYVPENPGTRSGSGDDALKAMKTLLSATSDATAKEEIQKEIDKRVGELKPKPAPVNVGALPDALKHLAQ